VSGLRGKFKVGVPALALVEYIKALQRKEAVTHGVSFETQEATSQEILRALRDGCSGYSTVSAVSTPSTTYSFRSPQSLNLSS
jgi:hypothetical protein